MSDAERSWAWEADVPGAGRRWCRGAQSGHEGMRYALRRAQAEVLALHMLGNRLCRSRYPRADIVRAGLTVCVSSTHRDIAERVLLTEDMPLTTFPRAVLRKNLRWT